MIIYFLVFTFKLSNERTNYLIYDFLNVRRKLIYNDNCENITARGTMIL